MRNAGLPFPEKKENGLAAACCLQRVSQFGPNSGSVGASSKGCVYGILYTQCKLYGKKGGGGESRRKTQGEEKCFCLRRQRGKEEGEGTDVRKDGLWLPHWRLEGERGREGGAPCTCCLLPSLFFPVLSERRSLSPPTPPSLRSSPSFPPLLVPRPQSVYGLGERKKEGSAQRKRSRKRGKKEGEGRRGRRAQWPRPCP